MCLHVFKKLLTVVIHQNKRLNIERDGNEGPGDPRKTK